MANPEDMIDFSKITTSQSVGLPKSIQRRLGVTVGDLIGYFENKNGEVVIQKVDLIKSQTARKK
jgi:bifunctional DNA-binding transcriptional regulator/antitoxin component of YhaV-PrlF toxin-antitoxin module